MFSGHIFILILGALGFWYVGIWRGPVGKVFRARLGRGASKIPEQPFVPPTAWTGHRIAPGSCRCFTDPDVKASLADMDPLLAEAFHNLTCSPLCSLPEDLLLSIMLSLDTLSIQCLRRSCRLFLRLYDSPEFRHCHDPSKREQGLHLPWNEPHRASWGWRELGPLLERDIGEYCADCRAIRSGSTWEKKVGHLMKTWLYCVPCATCHPAGLFSAAQRRVGSEIRKCIGHEGQVRLCNHRYENWAHIAPIASSLRSFRSWEGYDARVLLNECDDLSHLPRHHSPNPHVNLHRGIFPRACISGRSGTNTLCIKMRWIGHLRIPETGEAVTPTRLRQELERYRQGVAEFIAPEHPPGRMPEMNCLDPNQCSCLDYPGLERVPVGWQLAPTEHYKPRLCRKDPNFKLRALRPQEGDDDRNFAWRERCFGHTAWFPGIRTKWHGLSSLDIGIEPCPGSNSCVLIRYIRKIQFPFDSEEPMRVPLRWLEAIDPNSYNITDDEESYGVLWCWQRGCRNYYRYAKRFPFRTEDFDRR